MARDQYLLDGADQAYGGIQGLHRPKDSPFRQTHLSEQGDREMETDGAAARTDASIFARAGKKVMQMKARMEQLQEQI